MTRWIFTSYAAWLDDVVGRLEVITGLLRNCLFVGDLPDGVPRGEIETIAEGVSAVRARLAESPLDVESMAWVAGRLGLLSRAATLAALEAPCGDPQANGDLTAAADDLRSLARDVAELATLTPLSLARFRGAA